MLWDKKERYPKNIGRIIKYVYFTFEDLLTLKTFVIEPFQHFIISVFSNVKIHSDSARLEPASAQLVHGYAHCFLLPWQVPESELRC